MSGKQEILFKNCGLFWSVFMKPEPHQYYLSTAVVIWWLFSCSKTIRLSRGPYNNNTDWTRIIVYFIAGYASYTYVQTNKKLH